MSNFPGDDDDAQWVAGRKVPTPEELDNKPIWFGKWKGKTPLQIVELEVVAPSHKSYIVWAYENVTHASRPVFCSEALYRSCGGKFKSAKQQADEKAAKEAGQRQLPNVGNAARPARGFDNLDDDIPF